jgi:hypothetical protein
MTNGFDRAGSFGRARRLAARSGAAMVAAIALVGLAASSASAAPATTPLPKGLLGFTPNTASPTERDFQKMRQAGAGTVRRALSWVSVQHRRTDRLDWGATDRFMVQASRNGLAVNLMMATTPAWARAPHDSGIWGSPIATAIGRLGWTKFVRGAVDRYGRGGAFWRAHRELSYRPVVWTVWNEPNLDRFWAGRPDPAAFANLIDFTGSLIHRTDSSARVVAGGVFCDYGWMGFIQRFYQAGVDKSNFEDVALHPYSESPYGSFKLISAARQVLNNQHDPSAGIWVDEISWGTDTRKKRFVTTEQGQAENIRILFQILAYQHQNVGLTKLLWFGLRDDLAAGNCQFCASSGLLRHNGITPKPSWFSFKGFVTNEAGAIRGTVHNHKGKPAEGQSVYLDLNGNNHNEPDEPLKVTGEDGSFYLPHLFATSYAVRLAKQLGERCEKPKGCERTVDVAAGEEVGGQRFVVGPNPPDTKITKAKVKKKKGKAKFKFRGRRGAKPYDFQCKMDKKHWKNCKSGKTYKHLKPGKHKFRVRTVDAAKLKDRTPAKEKFKIKRR